jgi:capsular polysaccharide biosynthesis protein
MMQDLSGAGLPEPDLGAGSQVSQPRRLDCLRDVHLVWSNLFIAGAGGAGADGAGVRCATIFDWGVREAMARVADYPGLSAYAGIERRGDDLVVSRAKLARAITVPGPVMFATSDQPHNWGMWLTYVLPAVLHFIAHRSSYSRLFVYADHPNMRAMLRLLGLRAADVLLHDCSVAHHFEEVHVFRQPRRDLHVSAAMLEGYAVLRRRVLGSLVPPHGDRLYVSRRRRTAELGSYRGLMNEAELIDQLRPLGFSPIDPEYLPAEEQVALFAGARQVVALGGAGAFNVVFCDPDTRFVDIESSLTHLRNHTDLFASCGLDYGLLIGREDPDDPAPNNKRWSIDAARAAAAVAAFMT